MKSANPWKRIFDTIGEAAALEMVAEEAAELSATAAKLARIVRGENPARVNYGEAEEKLIEEVADVYNALDVLDTGLSETRGRNIDMAAKRIAFKKMKRWYKDLFGTEESYAAD